MSERGFSILSWTAAAPGFADPASWLSWAESDAAIDPAAPFTVPKTLPLMTSRRLSPALGPELNAPSRRREARSPILL